MHANSIGEFDNIDTSGNTFWQKTVGPLHKSVGNRKRSLEELSTNILKEITKFISKKISKRSEDTIQLISTTANWPENISKRE